MFCNIFICIIPFVRIFWSFWNSIRITVDTQHNMNGILGILKLQYVYFYKHGACMKYYHPNMNEYNYFNLTLSLYNKYMNNGIINEKCGLPNKKECWLICFDLHFNLISCN